MWPKCTLVLLVGTIIFGGFMLGCGGGSSFVNPPHSAPPLLSIFVQPSNSSLTIVDQTEQLIATGVYSDGTSQNLNGKANWSSSDPNAVSVNAGLIKAVSVSGASGVTITASSGTIVGTAAVCVGGTCTTSSSITVTCDSCTGNSISLSASGGAGISIQFSASQNGSDVSTSATWTSSNSSVISITSNGGGVATLEGVGSATITANVSGATGSLTVSVSQ